MYDLYILSMKVTFFGNAWVAPYSHSVLELYASFAASPQLIMHITMHYSVEGHSVVFICTKDPLSHHDLRPTVIRTVLTDTTQ